GITTPLVFSYASIGIYLILVTRREVAFPSAYMLALILLLTFAHAVLMVSSAIVISVQATTIRAANLLASFVVVPVAFLLQGETILIFWGNEDVLWFAIVGVTLLATMLVRLGLSHFRREYLLGREIDTIDLKWIGRTFRNRFQGQAKSLLEWYRTEIPISLRELRQPLMIVIGLSLIAGIVSYMWVTANVPAYIDLSPERIGEFRTFIADNLTNLDSLGERLPAPVLFYHNARTTVAFLLLGLVSFGTLGLTLFIGNIALVGGVLGGAHLVGYSPWLAFAAGILPHGVFELPAIFIATAAVLKVGAQLVTPQPDKSLGEVLLVSLADWFRIFIGIVLPFLAIAAVIEIYITPLLIKLAFPYF
ncbi:MAG TPA: stage II sporulation protein M, partial [Anaerolineales bacterium]|nr:stage II sporulation protein M [Anaerolineales bacterium]